MSTSPRYRSFAAPVLVLGAALCVAAVASAYETIEVENGGSISGSVTFKGKPPVHKLKVHQDGKHCGGSKPSPRLKVGKGGGVQDAVVRLVEVPKGRKYKKGKPVLDQKNCVFVPHVQLTKTGSKLRILNSDGVLHNVHAYLGESTLFNIAMPFKDQKIKKKLKKPGLVELKCDAGHTWMSAYVLVSDHPYAAVTDAEGKFSITDVPPGSYEIEMWHAGWKLAAQPKAKEHPRYGDDIRERKKVQVEAGGTASVDFVLGD